MRFASFVQKKRLTYTLAHLLYRWGVRNVAMMLFAALCSRAFSSRRTNSDKRTARMPFHEFFARYGSLQTFLLEQLSDAVRSDLDKMPVSMHGP